MYLGLLRGNLSLKQMTIWSISLTHKEISTTPFHWHNVKKGLSKHSSWYSTQNLIENEKQIRFKF